MDKTNNLEKRLKAFMVLQGTNLNKVIKDTNERIGTTYTQPNFSKKLKNGSLTFVEIENLINTMGYKFDLF